MALQAYQRWGRKIFAQLHLPPYAVAIAVIKIPDEMPARIRRLSAGSFISLPRMTSPQPLWTADMLDEDNP